MRKRKSLISSEIEMHDFWPSFTDMMSTIALILFFLMVLAYINNIFLGNNLQVARTELDSSKVEISKAEEQLKLLQDEVEKTSAELEKGKIALKMSEEEVERQKQIIANSNTELGRLRSNLAGIAVLRLSILEKVKASIETEMGTRSRTGEPLVAISDTGNIIINENLVFESGSAAIKPEGKKLLEELAFAFEKVLKDDEVRNSIDAINIQGHTDTDKSRVDNRDLGASRSSNVVKYMLAVNPDLERDYGAYFLSSSYSEYRPIQSNTSREQKAANRRIEISIVLKDSEVQNLIDRYLEGSMDAFR